MIADRNGQHPGADVATEPEVYPLEGKHNLSLPYVGRLALRNFGEVEFHCCCCVRVLSGCAGS